MISLFGVAAALIGFVRGLFFGVQFTTPLHKFIPLPEAIKAGFTIASVPLFLEIAVIVGAFHLTAGYAIAFLNTLRSHDYEDAFLSHLPSRTTDSSASAPTFYKFAEVVTGQDRRGLRGHGGPAHQDGHHQEG